MDSKLANPLWRMMKKNAVFYLFLVPALITVIIFNYRPMVGVIMAFQDFSIREGMFASPFVGFKHFRDFFTNREFYNALQNTLLLNLYMIVIGFPLPIIFALMLNEIRSVAFKRVTQTITYLPHFISWVIITGMVYRMLDRDTGSIMALIKYFNNGNIIPLLSDDKYFRPLIVGISVWKELGWNSIIYLAAIAGLDTQLYEAATVDGAGRMKKLLCITLPGMAPTIFLLLILNIGTLVTGGHFDAVFNMQNPYIIGNATIIEYYVYIRGITKQEFSYATAVSLTQSTVAFLLVFGSNGLSRKIRGEGAF